MAYQNKISILIAAQDEASAAVSRAAERVKAAQESINTSSSDMAAAQEATASDVDAAQTSIGDSAQASASRVAESSSAMVDSASKVSAAQSKVAASAKEAASSQAAAAAETDAAAVSTKGLLAASMLGFVKGGRGLKVYGDTLTKVGKKTRKFGKSLSKDVSLPLLGVGVAAVVMAGNFQAQMTKLVTSAGETQANLQMVSNGVTDVARQTGDTTTQLANAMYVIESGGQHGADGLQVLKAAAEGARAEGADLTTVADATTSAMTDYHLAASQAANVTSKLVAATGQGKTTFQNLAAAMPAILPTASAAHITLSEILGDLASMTLHGISADQAAQNLAHTIRSLENPTAVQSKEFAALGLNATDVSQKLGKRGLFGTLQLIQHAIENQMGKGSNAVILNMTNALKGLPSAVQAVSQKVINGTATWRDWNLATKDLPVTQRAQAQAFATLYNGMHTIGTKQMSGAQIMQTYTQAMQKAVGTSDGLNVALMLTTKHGQNTSSAIKAVAGASADANGNVKGWSEAQQTFNVKMARTREELQTAAISIGNHLLPVVGHLATGVSKVVDWFSRLSPLQKTVLGDIAVALAVGGPIIVGVGKVVTAVGKITKGIGGVGKAIRLLSTKTIPKASANMVKSLGKVGGELALLAATVQGIMEVVDLLHQISQTKKAGVAANNMIQDNLNSLKKLHNEGKISDADYKRYVQDNLRYEQSISLSGVGKNGLAGIWNSMFGHALGTSYAPGGPTSLGESGAELVLGPTTSYLPSGSRVLNPRQTEQVLGGSGNVTVVIQNLNVNNQGDVSRVVRDIGMALANA